MVAITVVSRSQDGFALQTISVKSMDMKEIVRAVDRDLSWAVNSGDCELFHYNARGKIWTSVARRTGRGWVRISTFVKNWDKYASPSWVKRVKEHQLAYDKAFSKR